MNITLSEAHDELPTGTDTQAILFVPEKGDPLGLLADGVCGARPPMALRWTDATNVYWGACGSADVPQTPSCRIYDPGEALVLAWGGKPVPEGMDRLGRSPGRCGTGWVREVVLVHLGQRPDDSDALTDPDLPGTLVLLDAEGREQPLSGAGIPKVPNTEDS